MKNIRLVLSDMDGTLLNSKKELPKDFDFLFNKLKEKNIIFSVASGRGYASLKETFKDYLNDMYFISDNGSIIFYQDKCIFYKALPKEVINYIEKTFKDTDSRVIYCGVKKSYTLNYDAAHLIEARMYYKTLTTIANINDIDDDICKIAIYNKNDANIHVLPYINKLDSKYKGTYSSYNWVDVSYNDTNKGSALKYLQNLLNIKYEETMSFGDFDNDIELLENSYFSYAMENATNSVKKIARFTTDSCDNEGVSKILRKVVSSYD